MCMILILILSCKHSSDDADVPFSTFTFHSNVPSLKARVFHHKNQIEGISFYFCVYKHFPSPHFHCANFLPACNWNKGESFNAIFDANAKCKKKIAKYGRLWTKFVGTNEKFACRTAKPWNACALGSHELHVSCTPFALLTTYPTTSKTIFIVQQQNSWQNVTSTPDKSFCWHSCTAFFCV